MTCYLHGLDKVGKYLDTITIYDIYSIEGYHIERN